MCSGPAASCQSSALSLRSGSRCSLFKRCSWRDPRPSRLALPPRWQVWQSACLSTVGSALEAGGPSDHFAEGCRCEYHTQKSQPQAWTEPMSHSSAQTSFSQRLQPMAVFFVAVALWLNSAMAEAGPCTADISQFEATVHQSASDPFAGLTARQSVNAQLGRQPSNAATEIYIP
jgi:hypothetical protein